MAEFKSTASWGRDTARARYGQPTDKSGTEMAHKNESGNQFPEDQHDTKYDNDATGWVRGSASGPPTTKNETAENYPAGGFDHRNKDGTPKKPV